jgi:threonyl-tRNA synthetase
MIHRAIFGSLERFLGILIENFAGHFPLWLAPLQVVVATITSDADDYAQRVVAKLKAAGPGCRSRSPQREDQLQGPRALAGQGAGDPRLRPPRGGRGSVNVRRLGSRDQESMTLDAAIAALVEEATPPDVKRQKLAAKPSGLIEQNGRGQHKPRLLSHRV